MPSPLTISDSLWASGNIFSFFFFPNSHLLSLPSLSCLSSITSANFSSARLLSLLHLTTKQQPQQHTTSATHNFSNSRAQLTQQPTLHLEAFALPNSEHHKFAPPHQRPTSSSLYAIGTHSFVGLCLLQKKFVKFWWFS